MLVPQDRLAVHMAPVFALSFLIAGGFFDGWFSLPGEDVRPSEVRPHIEAIFSDPDGSGRIRLDGAWLADMGAVQAQYGAREFEPLWTSDDDRQKIFDALGQSSAHGIPPGSVHLEQAGRLIRRISRLDEHAENWEDEEVDPRPELLAELDVLLTDGVLRMAEALSGRRADPARLFPGGWFVGPTDLSTLAVQTALQSGSSEQVAHELGALRPSHAEYTGLQAALARLRLASKTWGSIPEGSPLRPGDRSIRVPYLRGRLEAYGYLPDSETGTGWDVADAYLMDDRLAGALNRFLVDNQIGADSVLTSAASEALNPEIDDLIATVELNLERWRWLPGELGEMHVLVNLPSFELNVRLADENGEFRNALSMPAVIGMVNAGTWTTPVMRDSLESIVFNPSWAVPRSIQGASLLPQARADSGTTLPMRGFDVYAGGSWVDPTMVDWDAALPGQYQFVQRPGPQNPMGRVKFVMPNDHAIIIHDTNNRANFNRPVRTFSNGCIHAGDARALAQFLLSRTNGWQAEAVDSAMDGRGEWVVPLDRPVPVHLLYFTAWPEADGRLRILKDVYGRDSRVRSALGYDAEVSS